MVIRITSLLVSRASVKSSIHDRAPPGHHEDRAIATIDAYEYTSSSESFDVLDGMR